MKSDVRRNQGIAWPEYLFLLAIVLMIASIAAPAWLNLRNQKRSIRAYSDIRILVSAAARFNSEYRTWPVVADKTDRDVRYDDRLPNATIVHILSARDDVGNEDHQGNPGRIDFFQVVGADVRSLRINDRGEVLDPWGEPYFMVFDSNYDNVCTIENSSYAPVIGHGVVIWSKGPDRKSDTRDDLLSWKL